MNKYTTRATLAHVGFWDSFVSTRPDGKRRPSLRAWRYTVVISVHLLFLLSYYADIQILEGSISGSRMLGFHLADPFITLEVMSAYRGIPTNLLIGAVSIGGFYLFFGGRAFCSWVCPYGIFGEIGERLHQKLLSKKIIQERTFSPYWRYIFWIFFLSLSFFGGFLVFELFNVVGILSRFIIYGWSAAISWVILIFAFEVFFSQRAWCRYVCPLGTTYTMLGGASAMKIAWSEEQCNHCGVCSTVCIVPHVLDMTKKKSEGQKGGKHLVQSGDCTLCGRCIDVCHTDALGFENRLKKLL
ncbi:NapH/MauN family ferredoxin-type protein [Wolinella succinogenes]|uniref:NAPH n=1 Tax=Wolinella succinogenes (strain ATCC 29543 / DSM 1740 / CCUG 13145 / JCM 31913 / LMG 7466 / NCTC 11488 / FDC 602W) TaxID=273121 RepID=Q7MRZ3_WOLSU|nr:NapH/MauN family ferredoxin-type protein [Wolinella succinogenes]CAE10027.1 NAPH [Wolinella succinogenes]VEG82238.1 Putative electron transport protein yccM [Wolinella succinogenes]HCZ19515.1 NapH/MauN family ferredoxin-type protein [Helicobacter sp.]